MRYLALIVVLAGCGVKPRTPAAESMPAPGAKVVTREFVDLQPGWRLQIVSPVTKSGSYLVETKPAKTVGNEITLKTSDDLLGYETASWALLARPGGGVTLKLTSAELVKEGKPMPIATPSRALIHPPKYARFLRVFYLTRRSSADHDMAVMGTAKLEQLEPLTARLRESPNEACANLPRQRIYCEWVPPGMAVRPERPKIVNGVVLWAGGF